MPVLLSGFSQDRHRHLFIHSAGITEGLLCAGPGAGSSEQNRGPACP